MNAFESASMIMLPHGRKAGKIYAVKPTNGNGDLTVDRNCPALEINSAGKLELVVANMPRFNHAVLGGCPKLLQEPEGTNLHEQPIKIGHSDYVKNNSNIEGDITTASAEKFGIAPNLESGWTDNGDDTFSCDGTDGARITESIGTAEGDICLVVLDCLEYTAGNITIQIGGSSSGGSIILSSVTSETKQLLVSSVSGSSIYIISSSFNGKISASVKVLSGYSSPCIDFPNHAFKFVDNTVNGSHSLNAQNIVTIASSDYVNMVCVKKLEHTWIALAFDNLANSFAWFDLDNGVIGTVQSAVTAKMIEIADGFYICSIKATADAVDNVPEFYLADADNSTSFAGNGTDGVLLFLADVKKTALFMLPVYDGVDGASTTRLREYSSCSNLQANNILGANEGSILFDFGKIDYAPTTDIMITIGTAFRLYFELGGLRIYDVLNSAYVHLAIPKVDETKYLMKWDQNMVSVIIDGAIYSNDYVPANPIVDASDIIINTTTKSSISFNKITPFKIALTDADCIALTT